MKIEETLDDLDDKLSAMMELSNSLPILSPDILVKRSDLISSLNVVFARLYNIRGSYGQA